MVNYDGLPVYKSSYDMLLQIFELVKKFEREYKFTLGESIKSECIQLITMIYKANSSQDNRKQHLTEARAFLKDTPILILDEATSAFDAQTERYLQTSFDEFMKNRTTFIITHRLSTIMKADRIFVFDSGRIVE